MQQYVQGLGNARSRHRLALHDGFVGFRTSDYVIRLDCQNFLQDVCGTEGFECPNFHFSETLTTELCLTTQRLLRDE